MKLYTEEQVRFIAKAIYNRDFDPAKSPTELVKELTSISLPNDEEIEKAGYYCENKDCFIDGAEWMKEQILNQNK